jgi:hypothetical protein
MDAIVNAFGDGEYAHWVLVSELVDVLRDFKPLTRHIVYFRDEHPGHKPEYKPSQP